MMEPEGPLPLFNAHLLKNAGAVFIHEGAKAAHKMQRMVDAQTFAEKEKLAKHPWQENCNIQFTLGGLAVR